MDTHENSVGLSNTKKNKTGLKGAKELLVLLDPSGGKERYSLKK